MKRLPTWAYAAFGPITGPLALRLVRSLEAGRPVLAALYGVAILATFVALPLILLGVLRGLR